MDLFFATFLGYPTRALPRLSGVLLCAIWALNPNSVQSQVLAWGSDSAGQLDVPPDLTDAIAISAGSSHCLALRRDGTVVAWGQNYNGQATVPSGLTNVVSVAAGGSHSLALTKSGTVVAWGFSAYEVTAVPSDLTNAIAIAAGGLHSLALRANGTVVAWGDNADGETKVPNNLVNVVGITCGASHSVALKADGTVVTWGDNTYGQTNMPPGLTNIVAVCCSSAAHTLALKADGTVVAWGLNNQGQTNVPPDLANVVQVATGGAHSMVLQADGTIVGWGSNNRGQSSAQYLPGTVALSCGSSFSVALQGDGPPVITSPMVSRTVVKGTTTSLVATAAGATPLAYQWRRNGVDLPGATDPVLILPNLQDHDAGLYSVVVTNFVGEATSDALTLTVVNAIIISQPTDQATFVGGSFELAVTALGPGPMSYQWQFNGTNIQAATTNPLVMKNLHLNQSGNYSVIITNSNGTTRSVPAAVSIGVLAAWGDNTYFPPGLTNVLGVACGAYHNLVLNGDGTVLAYGYNCCGQTTVPDAATNIIAVAAVANGSLALKADGTVITWGDLAMTDPPVVSNVVSLTACAGSVLALNDNGTLTAWGNPMDIPPLSNIVAIASGPAHWLALHDDGTVFGWGNTGSGAAVVPPGLSNVVAVAAGANHSVALKADGTVVGWGWTTVPAGLSNLVAISAGWSHTVAIKADGTLIAWGDNLEYTTNFLYGLSNVVSVASGWWHELALLSDGPFVRYPKPKLLHLGNRATVSQPLRSGRVCRLEFKDSLSDDAWLASPLFPGTGGLQSLSDTNAVGNQRFYRVRQW